MVAGAIGRSPRSNYKKISKNNTMNQQKKQRPALRQRSDGYIEFRKKKIEANGRGEQRKLG
jgi:hypothetical protein